MIYESHLHTFEIFVVFCLCVCEREREKRIRQYSVKSGKQKRSLSVNLICICCQIGRELLRSTKDCLIVILSIMVKDRVANSSKLIIDNNLVFGFQRCVMQFDCQMKFELLFSANKILIPSISALSMAQIII